MLWWKILKNTCSRTNSEGNKNSRQASDVGVNLCNATMNNFQCFHSSPMQNSSPLHSRQPPSCSFRPANNNGVLEFQLSRWPRIELSRCLQPFIRPSACEREPRTQFAQSVSQIKSFQSVSQSNRVPSGGTRRTWVRYLSPAPPPGQGLARGGIFALSLSHTHTYPAAHREGAILGRARGVCIDFAECRQWEFTCSHPSRRRSQRVERCAEI